MRENSIGFMLAVFLVASSAVTSFYLLGSESDKSDENKEFEFMTECVKNNTAEDCKDVLRGIGQR